jgi:hypothetical protein
VSTPRRHSSSTSLPLTFIPTEEPGRQTSDSVSEPIPVTHSVPLCFHSVGVSVALTMTQCQCAWRLREFGQLSSLTDLRLHERIRTRQTPYGARTRAQPSTLASAPAAEPPARGTLGDAF